MQTLIKKIVLLLPVLFISFSCREEIITPDNFVETINDPVQLRERNSYILLLNANNFTMDLTVPANFTSIKTRFNVTLVDYESGYTSVSVKDYNSVEKFRYFICLKPNSQLVPPSTTACLMSYCAPKCSFCVASKIGRKSQMGAPT